MIYPSITLDGFMALRTKHPKRVCFGSTHRNALKPSNAGKGAGFFNVPFNETISAFFPWDLFANKGQYGGYFRLISSDAEFAEVGSWLREHADLVFLRSLLNSAVATCEHYASQNARSHIGTLEHSAKYEGNVSAKAQLVTILKRAFDRLHQGRDISAVISVPPSVNGSVSLPNTLAARLGAEVGLPDLTASLHWNGPKGNIKALAVDAKWGALEAVGLTVGGGVNNQNLLLIDDMYQSGATAHFVASRLRAAGANEIHLLAVSKGRRDSDNT